MKIEYNEKEIAAMAEFHKGNRAEGLRLQEEFASEFRKEYADKDHCPCQKAGKRITVPAQRRADITETAKNVWQFTEPIRNTFQTVCAR